MSDLPTLGQRIEWERFDGGDDTTMHEGIVWSEAPVFRGMRAWWVRMDDETRYVARTSRHYITGYELHGRWMKNGAMIESGTFFEEVHPRSNMVKSLNKMQEKFDRRYVVPHASIIEMQAFVKLCQERDELRRR